MKKHVFLITIAALLLGCSSKKLQLENPISEAYPEAYPWTDSLKWNHIYNFLEHGGDTSKTTDNTETLNQLTQEIAKQGGGTVFFPKGTYYFSDNVYLANGVIWRGEKPRQVDAKNNKFSPPSKLFFPEYTPGFKGNGTPNETAFKHISTHDPLNDSNIGLVYLDINRAGIELKGAQLLPQAGYDPTPYKITRKPRYGTNRNILIYGIRNNNVAKPAPNIPAGYQHAWQRWSYRFVHNIEIQAIENVLVANCRINDMPTDDFEQPGYLAKDPYKRDSIHVLQGHQAVFRYTDHYGIFVNKDRLVEGLGVKPQHNPGLFRKGVVIRDNWVFNTMRVKIYASGKNMIIKDNVLRDRKGKRHWLDRSGEALSNYNETLECRGIDWGGEDVLIEGNDIQVYPQLRWHYNDSNSIDGEAILVQECCGGTYVNGLTIRNNKMNSYIGLWKMRDIKNVKIVDNTIDMDFQHIAQSPLIYVNADVTAKNWLKPGQTGSFRADNIEISGNRLDTDIHIIPVYRGAHIFFRGTAGTSNVVISDNRPVDITKTGVMLVTTPDSITIKNNEGFKVIYQKTDHFNGGPEAWKSKTVPDE